MKPWEILDRTRTADGTELTLVRHTTEYVIAANGQTLMSNRMYDSEESLAILGCHRARMLAAPHVLIGGLGMGFTLRAALNCLPTAARVTIVELVPAVVAWNQGVLGALAHRPLDDPRVHLEHGDVTATLRLHPGTFDAVLLDVDNGMTATSTSGNAGLYGRDGLAAARASLTPGGVLAFWSAKDDRGFEGRLRSAGFTVQRERVRGGKRNRGPRHIILVAQLSALV